MGQNVPPLPHYRKLYFLYLGQYYRYRHIRSNIILRSVIDSSNDALQPLSDALRVLVVKRFPSSVNSRRLACPLKYLHTV